MNRMLDPQNAGPQSDFGLEKLDRVMDILSEVKEEMELLRKLLAYMTDIDFTAEEALHQWERIILHRNDLRQRLSREIDFTVALADYFTHVYKTPTSPWVLARSRILKLQSHASSDFLTGIYNRYFFDEYINKEISRANRQKSSFSLILLDINDFKRVNDSFGHQKGDAVLSSIAENIRTVLREQDIPCRYGGDEFVCILPNTSYFHALVTAERIRRKIYELSTSLDLGFKLSLAYGLATYPWDGQEPEEVVRACDRRLYEYKTEIMALKTMDRRLYQRIKTPGNRASLRNNQSSIDLEVLDIGSEGIGLKTHQLLEVGAIYHADLLLDPPLTHARADVEVIYLQEEKGSYRIGGKIRDIAFLDHAAG